jgi:quercetin dioxygenase-like cupin family protein
MQKHTAVSACVLLACIAYTANAAAQADTHSLMAPKDMKWGPAPPSLPKGAKVTVLQGDPGKSGPFVLRLMTPGAYTIPPHWHSQDEQLTVISGTFYLGLGDKYDVKKATGLPAGGFHFLPAKEHHYAFSKGPAVVQVSGNGPFDITYLNPGDDPQKKM